MHGFWLSNELGEAYYGSARVPIVFGHHTERDWRYGQHTYSWNFQSPGRAAGRRRVRHRGVALPVDPDAGRHSDNRDNLAYVRHLKDGLPLDHQRTLTGLRFTALNAKRQIVVMAVSVQPYVTPATLLLVH